jgi:hypothetical protein
VVWRVEIDLRRNPSYDICQVSTGVSTGVSIVMFSFHKVPAILVR